MESPAIATFTRCFLLLVLSCLASQARQESAANTLWKALEAKRNNLLSFHQEFEVATSSKSASGVHSMTQKLLVDVSKGRWRERSINGSGTHLRIFDGTDSFFLEDAGTEFIKSTPKSKEGEPQPEPYQINSPDWDKAVELERRPCGVDSMTHPCVLLKVPLKAWSRLDHSNHIVKAQPGTEMILLDPDTGLILSTRSVQIIDTVRTSYLQDVSYSLVRMNFGSRPEESLFSLPADCTREVKELSRWNAAKIKKQLAGSTAPELSVTDIQGKPISLADLKGKTVLLDFWTTWCPPCRADAPALDKLYRKYGGKDLMIVGLSVSEEREIVEKFLKEHPHDFPVVLTSENDMPRPYQIGAFPTYIVINRDGTVASASEGDQGFGELRKLLTKAGLDTE